MEKPWHPRDVLQTAAKKLLGGEPVYVLMLEKDGKLETTTAYLHEVYDRIGDILSDRTFGIKIVSVTPYPTGH